jgi:plastocyanin
MAHEMEQHHQQPSSESSSNSKDVSIVSGAATLGSKAFSPSVVKVKVGSIVTWTNKDNNIHTLPEIDLKYK